ncbi:MAG: T9SS type A sorting domain-containing protein [Bacteroidales bacterium]|nr:T9SS type A sorting domain-containing protein [Bacteroidales bacterium]
MKKWLTKLIVGMLLMISASLSAQVSTWDVYSNDKSVNDYDEVFVNFETGDFSQANFIFPAENPWVITDTNIHRGIYCMKSACDGISMGTSYIEIMVDNPDFGYVSFYVSPSSEENYDRFYFYIDNVEQDVISGNYEYEYKEYEVTPGSHIYKWLYQKDSAVNSYDDCIYVDNIVLFRSDHGWGGLYWEPWENLFNGNGTESDPFLIEKTEHLAYLAYRVNNGLDSDQGHVSNHDHYYRLETDIDLVGDEYFEWTPIGYWISDADYQCFGGHFDGNNHIIDGIYINGTNNRAGLFGYTDGALITNISNVSGTIETLTGSVAGIAGCATNGTTIKNCTNGCNVIGGSGGGIVGRVLGPATVANCKNEGDVHTHFGANVNSEAGGIIGCINAETNIINCYNNGDILSDGYYAGGIIGCNYNSYMNIFNCYNKGSIDASNNSYKSVGGIIGRIWTNYTQNTIANCYNTGNTSQGGIVGVGSATVSNCYYLNTCGGNNTNGGEPKTEVYMKSHEFVDVLNNGSCIWNFDEYYSNSGYPVLTGIYVDAITLDATEVTQSHATLHGSIEVENTSVQSQGFEYKKSSDNEWHTVSVSGNGVITKTLSDLIPNTQYIYRTFCTPNDCGTTYGTEKSFTTQSITVATNNVSNITQTHATLYGVINAGDANISTQGFEYKKATDNTWQATWVSGNGDISKTLSGLSYNTQYYFRTFCTLQGGETVYGQEKSFNTLAITISTNNATNVTQTHATLEGNVNSGDANVWAGFEYKTQGTSWHTVNVSGSGNITKTLSNLIPNTHYIYRTYCSITENGTIYGEEREFTTMNVNVATDPATDIDNNSAILHGVVNIGDATLRNKGFQYYQLSPAFEGPFVVYVTDESNEITTELEGLDMFSNGGAIYMYKTFVTIAEKEGIIYGNDEEFSWYDAQEILVYDMDMMFSIAGACYNGETFENKTIILLNNIEFPVASENFISIGSYPDNPFRGTFYGNGKTISNLALGQTNMHYQGLFGYTQGAMISSLMLDNVNIYGRNYCGGIVAYADNTFIYESCIVNSSINALNYCGGIVGYVEGENTDVMGCYSTCNVSGNNYVGGLVGNSNIGAVRNSYAAGSVSGHGNAVGGILGGAHETLMINCYFNTDITGQSVAIGENYFKDGEGVTTTQMRMPQFVATMNQGITPAIWIADNIPYINNGFPILYWQTSGGESCGAPQNLSHSISGNQITLNWAIVDEADYYIVKYATINGIEHTQVTEQNSFTFNAVQDSTYSWRVKSVCPNGESVFVNGNNVGLGVDENDAVSNHLVLYPNPANELVTIKLDDENYGLKMIKVFDISGREMVSVNASGQEYNLDVSILLKGIYFVRVITDDNNVANLKLLVK